MPHRPPASTLPMPLSPPAAGQPSPDALPKAAPSAPAAGFTARPSGVRLSALALLFVTASVVVAAGLGFALASWAEPAAPWMVGLASAVGVLFTALPLGAALLGLASRTPAATDASGANTSPGGDTARAAGAAGGRSGAPAAAQADTLPNAGAILPRGLGLALPAPMSREHFMDLVGREWSRARRYGTGAALLLVEIDRYPRLTDALGDAAGEKVLADVLAATSPTLRGADALARFEAGRMAVFLAHADATGALDVAERIRERSEQMETAVPPRRVRFTVSVGVAHLRPAHLHLQALVDDVTDALTAARGVGGNCVRAAPVDQPQRPAPGPARDGSRADKG